MVLAWKKFIPKNTVRYQCYTALVTTLSLVAATITLANAERPKAKYTPVVEISAIHPYAKIDAYRAYRAERRAQFRAQTVKAKEKAVEKRLEENKPAPITAESLFAAKMAERHGTK
jgi:hypothetical protein